MRCSLVALFCIGLGCGGSARSSDRHRPEGPATLFQGVAVFDGTALAPHRDVLIVGDRIVEVGAHIDPSGATVIDGNGKTLVPGLIDAHAHIWEPDQLRQSAVFGVTTVLDMLTAPKAAQAIKAQLAEPAGRELADLRTAGNAVTAPGGHGTEYGLPLRTIEAPEEAPAFIDACIAEGSDYIKLIYDDGRAYGIHFENISKETLAAAVTAAHARDKLAIAHIGSQQGAKEAIEAGADGLAHLFVDSPVTQELVSLLEERGAFVIPTLLVNQSLVGMQSGTSLLDDPEIAPYLSAENAASLRQEFPRPDTGVDYAFAEKTVQTLHEAHIPILAGTDAPNPGTTHGASLHAELELLVRAGLTPAEALAAATSVPAARFGLGDRGRIAAGARADLVLVEGDPTQDIHSLRRIAGVWNRGVRIGRDEYAAAIEERRSKHDGAATSRPAGSEAGLVSDFENGEPSTSFGAGWSISTDAIMGGKSRAEMKVVSGGASGSKSCLAVSGEVVGGSANAWAGAMFSPGDRLLAPADLSGKQAISFWAKGDGRTYAVMLFAESRGASPAFEVFEAGSAWKQYSFALSDFDGLDGHDLTGLFFGAGGAPGTFAFQVDDVEFR